MYTIEAGNYLFWFEVLECKLSEKYAVRVTEFGWPDRYRLRRRTPFTQASADSAARALTIFFTAPNQMILDVSIPKEQWISEVIFSPNWILASNLKA